MSMRIGNQAEGSFVDSARSSATKATGTDSSLTSDSRTGFESDRVNLSSASGLVALAKTLVPADKQAKLQALSNQVSSGDYRPEASEVGKALVSGYLKSK